MVTGKRPGLDVTGTGIAVKRIKPIPLKTAREVEEVVERLSGKSKMAKSIAEKAR